MPTVELTKENFSQTLEDNDIVLVDFWAAWCGPCRKLGPVLEQAAEKREGEVVLVKVDTDENPGIANRFGIQGIPAVKAFRDGEVVAEFVGAQPPSQVEAFFDGLVPSETQQLLDAGDEESLRKVVEKEPANVEANFGLGKILYRNGESEAALEVLRNAAGSFGAEGLAARIELERSNGARPRLAQAFAKLDAGDHEAALDILLEELAAAEGDDKERLRRVIVAALDELGVEHPLAREARRRLAAALY